MVSLRIKDTEIVFSKPALITTAAPAARTVEAARDELVAQMNQYDDYKALLHNPPREFVNPIADLTEAESELSDET